MAVPQRRTSKTRKRLRRTHFKLSTKGLVTCPHCGEMIQSHRVCPYCGFYNGKQIVKNKKEEKAKLKAAAQEKKNSKKDAKKESKKAESKDAK